MTSQPEQQTVAMHIFPYISRSKENQTMKFGQLIEYNMWKTTLEKICTKFYGETSPRPFLKNKKAYF